ncbi:nucleolar and coiled-body phosphoprotein 1 [Phyllostomus discolor]|uniref:Nucleolar and coiled-body phosphoprotein 1 n=1 Tax=Phyllostomus discolor TaxID=89673 RepID=A0A834ADG4_9CHIR|nr:nucleolar and coiled-body phosphoprotein 1 [Phyllostomus discolor]
MTPAVRRRKNRSPRARVLLDHKPPKPAALHWLSRMEKRVGTATRRRKIRQRPQERFLSQVQERSESRMRLPWRQRLLQPRR